MLTFKKFSFLWMFALLLGLSLAVTSTSAQAAGELDKIKKQEQAIRAQIKNLLLTQLELLKSSEEQPAYQDKIID